jgi:hypothetical protein
MQKQPEGWWSGLNKHLNKHWPRRTSCTVLLSLSAPPVSSFPPNYSVPLPGRLRHAQRMNPHLLILLMILTTMT